MLGKRFKSFYYCRSKSIQRAENINDAKSTDITANVYKSNDNQSNEQPEYEVFIMSVAEKIKVENKNNKPIKKDY